MKKTHTCNNKPTFVALLFFAAMTVVGVTTAHAQDTINPLVATTGPNVLGSGHIQWNTSLMWDHMHTFASNGTERYNGIGARTGFRFGIGNRAELTLGIEAFHYDYKSQWDESVTHSPDGDIIGIGLAPDNLSIAPSVGARLLLYEGAGWLPKVTFYTSVALASVHGREWTDDETLVQPTIGLSFRNDLGKGWMLDYAVDFTWNRNYPLQNFRIVSYSVFARWLATDRLMLGAGFNSASWIRPFMGAFEVSYLATPDLQLTLQGGLSGEGLGVFSGTVQTHAMAGVSWMLR